MTRPLKTVAKITVAPDLWSTSIMPEGLLEKWLFNDGSSVSAGDPVATLRIEDALHDLLAPSTGRLSITVKANSMVEPGAVIGDITREV